MVFIVQVSINICCFYKNVTIIINYKQLQFKNFKRTTNYSKSNSDVGILLKK